MLTSLVTFFLVGLAALVALGVVLAIVGLVFSAVLGLAGFVLFKVVPVVLLGYVIVRFLAPKEKRLEQLERNLLETD